MTGWGELLRMNHITKEDAKEHGDAIIDILRFHQEQVVRGFDSFRSVTVKMIFEMRVTPPVVIL